MNASDAPRVHRWVDPTPASRWARVVRVLLGLVKLRSLRMRLMLLIALVALPALALTVRSGIERRDAAADRVREQGATLARSVAAQDEQAVARSRELLVPIVTLLQLMPDFRAVDSRACTAFLGAFSGGDTIYASVGVAAENGDVTCSSVAVQGTVNVADRPYFQQAMRSKQPTVGAYVVDRISGKAAFNVAAPVLSLSGAPRGVVFAAIALAHLEPAGVVGGLPPGSFAAVTDNEGTILARFPNAERYVGQPASSDAAFRAVLPGRKGTIEALNADGVPSLIAFTPLAGLGGQALAVVGIPRAAAFAASDDALRRDLLLLVLLTGAVASVAWFASDRLFLRPLDGLVRATRRVETGDYSVRIGTPYAGSELGDLGRAFDGMTSTIEQRATEIEGLNASLERRVEQRTMELVTANAELEAFAYTVSHDLRSPLRAIDGFAELLKEQYATSLDTSAHHYLDRVRDGARRMAMLIDDLLQFSRISRTQLQRHPASVNDIVTEALLELRAEMSERRIELDVADLGTAFVDPSLMRRVYVNLLSNAVKFTRECDVARISVGCEPNEGGAVYFVRDNGVGFDMAYSNKLFGVFQRLHLPEEYEGTGVGLAIVHRVVRSHGGQVWADARVGEGATFYLTIGAEAAA